MSCTIKKCLKTVISTKSTAKKKKVTTCGLQKTQATWMTTTIEILLKIWKCAKLTTFVGHHAASSPTARKTEVEEIKKAVEEVEMEEASRQMRIKLIHLVKTAMVSTQKPTKIKKGLTLVKEAIVQTKKDSRAVEVVETKFTTATGKEVAREALGRASRTPTGKPETECACQLNIAGIMGQVVLQRLVQSFPS